MKEGFMEKVVVASFSFLNVFVKQGPLTGFH